MASMALSASTASAPTSARSNGPPASTIITWIDDGRNRGSNGRAKASPRRRKGNAIKRQQQSLLACLSNSSLVTKASLAMVIWSIVNVFLSAFLIENISDQDKHELQEEVNTIIDTEVNLVKNQVGLVKDVIGNAASKAAGVAEENLFHGLGNSGERFRDEGIQKDGARRRRIKVKQASTAGSHRHHHALRAADKPAEPAVVGAADSSGVPHPPLKPPARRFPRYGTPEFAERCPWTALPPPLLSQNDRLDTCMFLVRPAPKDGEGLAAWAAKIPTEYMMAKQTGCKLKISYGPGVMVEDVWTPQSDATSDATDTKPYDWTLTKDEEDAIGVCKKSKNCFGLAPKTKAHLSAVEGHLRTGTDSMALAPMYRYAAHGLSAGHPLYQQDYMEMPKVLHGWELNDAAACAFGAAVQLSPKADQYEPDLYTKMLPTLYRERSLVMAIYSRSLNSDKMADQAAKGEKVDETGNLAYAKPTGGLVECAQKVEQQFLSGEKKLGDGVDIDTVIWFVISDSKAIKNYVAQEFGEKEIASGTKTATRKVISTNARGAHTRRKRDPSTADFAEALIDWHLMGETDLIIGQAGFSFQTSAAVRTSTPYYEHNPCEPVPLVYDKNSDSPVRTDVAGRQPSATSKDLVLEPKYTATNRFPTIESTEFNEICSWTEPSEAAAQCTIFVKPNENEHEGLAMWVATISAGYIIAKQKNCKFKLSYGDVDLSDILRPQAFLKPDHVDEWKIPRDFSCNVADQCYEIHSTAAPALHNIPGVPEGSFPFAEVPVYRHYTASSAYLYRDRFNPLKKVLPNLSLETAFACSMSRIMHLSPHIRKFDQQIQSKILPALRAEESLVITIYYRTGHAEASSAESTAKDLEGKDKDMEKSISCAKQVEQGFLDGSHRLDRHFTSVVWNFVCDSPYAKKDFASKFDGTEAKSSKGKTYPRHVVTTSSRGAHTKTQEKPTVADFAEAFIDWYNVGESDAVILHQGWSFGMTAALRTARPVFLPWHGCSPPVLVHDGDGKDAPDEAVHGNFRGAAKKVKV